MILHGEKTKEKSRKGGFRWTKQKRPMLFKEKRKTSRRQKKRMRKKSKKKKI